MDIENVGAVDRSRSLKTSSFDARRVRRLIVTISQSGTQRDISSRCQQKHKVSSHLTRLTIAVGRRVCHEHLGALHFGSSADSNPCGAGCAFDLEVEIVGVLSDIKGECEGSIRKREDRRGRYLSGQIAGKV